MEVLINLRVRTKMARTVEKWLILYHAFAHTPLSVKKFLTSKCIITLEYPHTCQIWHHFELVDAEVLEKLTEVDLLHIFDHCKTRLQWYVSVNGVNIKNVIYINKAELFYQSCYLITYLLCELVIRLCTARANGRDQIAMMYI